MFGRPRANCEDIFVEKHFAHVLLRIEQTFYPCFVHYMFVGEHLEKIIINWKVSMNSKQSMKHRLEKRLTMIHCVVVVIRRV
jgi:hypothetical protein